MAFNPNFPNTEFGWGPLWNANNGAVPVDKMISLSGRTIGSIAAARGKQYELDQSQSGTLSAQLNDSDGSLDPTNSAGPWFGAIAPYQPIRMRLQYPPTANLLLPGQSTGGDGYATGAIPAELDMLSTCDPSGGKIVASGTAFQGSNVFQFDCTAGNASGSTVGWTRLLAGRPGATYTAQMRVRNITASTSQSVKARISYYNSAGTSVNNYGSPVTLVGSATASWSLITITYTMPANAYAMQVGFSVNSTSVACSIQMDAWQVELGSTATAWGAASPWYGLFAGFVERWPTEWRDAGTFGVVSPTAVDAFALLSQRDIRDPLTEEIESRNPRFSYPLSDPQGATSFADETGGCGPLTIGTSRLGAGTLTVGADVTATDPVNGVWAANGSTVVTLSNGSPGTATAAPATFLTGAPGVNGPAAGSWSRAIAFRYTGPKPTGTGQVALWTAGDSAFNPVGALVTGTGIQVYMDTNGRINLVFMSAGTGAIVTPTGGAAVDTSGGNWHLAIVGYNSATGGGFVSVDGQTTALGSPYPGFTFNGPGVAETIGAWPNGTAGGATAYNFSGDIAYVTEFPSYLNSTACSALYSAWKTAFLGDSTDQRYARILGWAGYTGATDIATGQTRSMGAAKGGSDAMSLLQAVVETENGNHWVSPTGAVTFRGRATRYNSLTPAYVFGERTDLGEFPYEELTLDYDSTHLANFVEVTQDNSGQKFTASDATSQAAYFPRSMSRTVDTTDPTEARAAAGYLLSRYRNPVIRITGMTLHPGGNPALWPVCLALEIGTRIRVMRRAGAAPAIQLDVFVEHLSWTVDDQNDAVLTVQCTPVDPTPYALFSAFHTTLQTAVVGAVQNIVINPPADGNTGPLNGIFGPPSSLIIEPGTANSDGPHVLLPASNNNTGWTGAGVSFSVSTSHTHSVGAVVSEVLPAGVVDPATWDASAAFDAVAFAY